MLRNLTGKLRGATSSDKDDETLLDTEEQAAIIEKLRGDNNRTNRFHRISLQFSGILLTMLKVLCGVIQLCSPWILPMHEVVRDSYPSFFVIFLELYSSTFLLYFSLYINNKKMQESNFVAYSLLTACAVELLISCVLWWPELVVPFWFSGGTLMYGIVILYCDTTLKETARDIDGLQGLMYSFKKL